MKLKAELWKLLLKFKNDFKHKDTKRLRNIFLCLRDFVLKKENMKKIQLLIILCFFITYGFSQSVIKGKINDNVTGEKLPNASI